MASELFFLNINGSEGKSSSFISFTDAFELSCSDVQPKWNLVVRSLPSALRIHSMCVETVILWQNFHNQGDLDYTSIKNIQSQ